MLFKEYFYVIYPFTLSLWVSDPYPRSMSNLDRILFKLYFIKLRGKKIQRKV